MHEDVHEWEDEEEELDAVEAFFFDNCENTSN